MSVAISIKNLTKTYATGFEALKGISLEVNQGDFFALLGPNGAGKSYYRSSFDASKTKLW